MSSSSQHIEMLDDDDDDYTAFMPVHQIAPQPVPVSVPVPVLADDDDDENTNDAYSIDDFASFLPPIPAVSIDPTALVMELDSKTKLIEILHARLAIAEKATRDAEEMLDINAAELQRRFAHTFNKTESALQNLQQEIAAKNQMFEQRETQWHEQINTLKTQCDEKDVEITKLRKLLQTARNEIETHTTAAAAPSPSVLEVCNDLKVLDAIENAEAVDVIDATENAEAVQVSLPKSVLIAAAEFAALSLTERKKMSVSVTKEFAERLGLTYKGTKAAMLETMDAAIAAI